MGGDATSDRFGGLGLDLGTWVEAELGREVARCVRSATGGSRTTWLVDLVGDESPRSVVVRVEGQGSFTGTEVTLAREVTAFRALGPTSVPVPRVHALHPNGIAAILECLAGTDDLDRLVASERAAVMDDFAAVLAEMHRVDSDELELPGFERPSTPEEHARLDLRMWQRLASSVADLDPLIAYCGAWLVAHAPANVARTVFVQGDTGPGNFMAAAGRVSGLVDMEFAHVGDPMDDIAWVMMRLRGADTSESFLAAYERHGGVPIDDASVAFYRLAVDYRCAVTTSLAVDRGGGARGWAPYQLQTHRFLDGIAARLATAAGVEIPRIDLPDAGPTPRTAMFDRLLATIKTAARSIDDPEVSTATRNDQILVHVLRAHDQFGRALELADQADLETTLGAGAEAISADGAAVAGATGDAVVLDLLLRRRCRQRLLWSTLLDR